jgi:YVTN family beta-propeller protein
MVNPGDQDTADGSVTRIDPATNAVVARVGVGSLPWAIAYAAGSLWIGLYDTPTVVRVSDTTNTVLARIMVAAPISAIAASDRAVWAVQDVQAPDLSSPAPAGTVTRLNYSGVTRGPFDATP